MLGCDSQIDSQSQQGCQAEIERVNALSHTLHNGVGTQCEVRVEHVEIVARTPFEPVPISVADQRIVASETDQDIVTSIARQAVRQGISLEGVGTVPTHDVFKQTRTPKDD